MIHMLLCENAEIVEVGKRSNQHFHAGIMGLCREVDVKPPQYISGESGTVIVMLSGENCRCLELNINRILL